MKKTTKNVRRIVVKCNKVFWMLVLSIAILAVNLPFLSMASDLIALNDQISWYNSSRIKTNEETLQAEEWMRIRERDFYNSPNVIVRTYSNMHRVFKGLILVAVFAITIAVIISWGFVAICILKAYRKGDKIYLDFGNEPIRVC